MNARCAAGNGRELVLVYHTWGRGTGDRLRCPRLHLKFGICRRSSTAQDGSKPLRWRDVLSEPPACSVHHIVQFNTCVVAMACD
jgi:hypothetical protein